MSSRYTLFFCCHLGHQFSFYLKTVSSGGQKHLLDNWIKVWRRHWQHYSDGCMMVWDTISLTVKTRLVTSITSWYSDTNGNRVPLFWNRTASSKKTALHPTMFHQRKPPEFRRAEDERPISSPDLNYIKHFWDQLDFLVYRDTCLLNWFIVKLSINRVSLTSNPPIQTRVGGKRSCLLLAEIFFLWHNSRNSFCCSSHSFLKSSN